MNFLLLCILAIQPGGDHFQSKNIESFAPGIPLTLEIESVKDSYVVGESIQFRVKGNANFHLYLWSIDRKTRKPLLLMPNTYSGDAPYRARTIHHVPERVAFRSYRPGTERVLVIASPKKLDIDPAEVETYKDLAVGSENGWQPKAVKMRRTLDTPFVRVIKVKITKKREDEFCDTCPQSPPPAPESEIFWEKPQINPVDTGEEERISENRRNKVAVEEDRAERRRQPRSEDPNAYPFVSTDYTEYGLDEKVNITIGANKDGFVYLFLIEREKDPQLLREFQVKADEVYHAKAMTEPPGGPQSLLAVYSPTAVAESERIHLTPERYRNISPEFVPKGLRMLGEEEEGFDKPFAFYTFIIR